MMKSAGRKEILKIETNKMMWYCQTLKQKQNKIWDHAWRKNCFKKRKPVHLFNITLKSLVKIYASSKWTCKQILFNTVKKKKEQKIMDKSKELQITDCTAIPAIHILPDISSGEN